jgi:hypothetical protein
LGRTFGDLTFDSVSGENHWRTKIEGALKSLPGRDVLPKLAREIGTSEFRDLFDASLDDLASSLAFQLRNGLSAETVKVLASPDSNRWTRGSLGVLRAERENDALREVARQQAALEASLKGTVARRVRNVVDTAVLTHDSWSRIADDVATLEGRRLNEARAKAAAAAPKHTWVDTRGKRHTFEMRSSVEQTPSMSHGALWFRWSEVLKVLPGAVALRISELPAEVRLLALSQLGEVPSDARSSENTKAVVAKFEIAVDRLAGEAYPEVADTLARRYGTGLLALATRERAGCRVVRVRASKSAAISIRVPRWEFLGIERTLVTRRFQERTADLPANSPVLFLGGDTDYLSAELLPNHFTARSFDGSLRFADRHFENLSELSEKKLEPQNTSYFNLLPESDSDIAGFSAGGTPRKWRKVRQRFDAAATRVGLVSAEASRQAILKDLGSGERDVIVIVGHGTSDAIFLPNGERISREDILALPPRSGGKRPLVLLIACRGGAAERGSRSVAQALLHRGFASGVLAATKSISPRGELASYLERLVKSERVMEVLRNRPKELELWVELARGLRQSGERPS